MFERNIEEEQEFLRTYNPGTWPRPALTADICVFRTTEQGVQLLLIQRAGHPFKGCLALPGGFSEPGEDIEQTAQRELAEEVGIASVPLERTYAYSGPNRDPRGWTATVAFACVLEGEVCAQAGDDAADAHWFNIDAHKTGDEITLTLTGAGVSATIQACIEQLPYSHISRCTQVQGEGLAFDHATLICDAYLYVEQALSA